MDTISTILAGATPSVRSSRGIVRISGDGAFDLIDACLATGSSVVRSRGVHGVRLRLGDFELPCLVLSMPGPRSYTGEDSAEIQCAGNPALLERIMGSMLALSAMREIALRRADPGEFTARAFFHGRLDLVQAEGVAATIAACSDAELRAAGMLREGHLGRWATELTDTLSTALALVEAGIDFTDEEDVVAIASPDLFGRLEGLSRRIDDLLRRATGMEQLEDIPRVVLRGEPNTGKSTLFNALLGRARAVVSDRAGTTRDVLAEPLEISTAHGPAEVMLVDLAGAADDDSALGQEMRWVASEALRRAALVLQCVPLGRLRPNLRGHEIVVNTMIDRVGRQTPRFGPSVSALRGEGLDDLRSLIAERLADQAVSLDADVLVLRQRHESCLREAKKHLAEAVDLVRPQTDQTVLHHAELIATSMRLALDELSGLAGRVSPDDLLGRIFSSFCIGK